LILILLSLNIRVGDQEALMKDELIPREFNLIGQETVETGRFASTLRNIPVALKICELLKELCSNAWLRDSTNPADLITEAALTSSSLFKIKVKLDNYGFQWN
jgi:6-phospho-beta-glucosidase